METMPLSRPRPVLMLVKSSAGGQQKFAHQAGYYLHNGRWHKVEKHGPAPKKAPKAQHLSGVGKYAPAKHLSDDEWSKLKLPADNVNAGSHNAKLDQLKEMSESGNVAGILAHGYGTNTYGKKQAAIANHLLSLHDAPHQVEPGQKPGEHPSLSQQAPRGATEAPEVGPDSGDAPSPDEKAAGHAEKVGDDPADKPKMGPVGQALAEAAKDGDAAALTMPDFTEGKTKAGVKAYYEKQAQYVLDHGQAGNLSLLYEMQEKGSKPNAKGKVSNTWAGKTANSKKFLELFNQAVEFAGGDASGQMAEPEPAPKVPRKVLVQPAPKVAAPAASAGNPQLDQIPWEGQKTASKANQSHNAVVDKIKEMAYAGDTEGLQALADAKAGAKQTYTVKQHKLATLALAALKESPAAAEPAVPDAPATADDGPKEGDTKVENGVTYVLKDGRWHKAGDDDPIEGWKAAIADGKAPTQAQAEAVEALGDEEKEMLLIEAGATYAGNHLDLDPDGDQSSFDAAVQQASDKVAELHSSALGASADSEPEPAPDAHPLDAIPMPSLGGLKNPAKVQASLEALKEKAKAEGPSALTGVTKKMKATGKLITTLPLVDGHGGSIKIKGYVSAPEAAHTQVYHYVESLKAVAKGKPAPAPAAAPTPAPAPGEPIPMDHWKQVGGQLGSNAGGRFTDDDGVDWYVKFPSDEDHARAEVLAARLYAAAGIPAQDAKFITRDGKLGIASRWTDVSKKTSATLAANDATVAGFAVDAWLGNWDVVGLDYDNLQLGGDGKAVRVDAGGSLMYRAQGKKKPFGSEVTELDSLRDHHINPQAANVFGHLTPADISASVSRVLAVSDAEIKQLAQQFGPGTDADKDALAATLIARKADLAKKHPKAAKAAEKAHAKASAPVYRIPDKPDFANWHAAGKGLSSKAPFNQQNNELVAQMQAIGQSGDVDAIKAMTFQPINEQGDKVGEPIPISQHPSQHIKAYWKDVLKGMTTPYVSPKEMMRKLAVAVSEPFKALSKAFPSLEALKGAKVKIGRYALLGIAKAGNPLSSWQPETKSLADGTISNQYLYDVSRKAFDTLSHVEKQAIKDYTGSSYSAMNSALIQGKNHDKAYNAIKGLDKAAVPLEPGTVLSRYCSFDKADDGSSSHGNHTKALQALIDSGEGTVLQEFGIVSTSTRSTTWSGKTHLKITVGEGVRGLYVAPNPKGGGNAISNHPGENELVLPYKTRFMVKKIHPPGHKFKDKDGSWGANTHGGDARVIELIALPPLD